MVSTYLSYNLVVRDMKASMARTANDAMVKRDGEYYKANIGKVRSVDAFLKDHRLYTYAMRAYGLEDMAYAKAFMKKVLESDLGDTNSFANKLTDSRYRDFASAYQFGTGTKMPQTEHQTEELIDLYTDRIEQNDRAVTAETSYYDAMLTRVKSVDEFLANPRLRDYMFKAYDIDGRNYDRALIRGLLVSDPNDSTSFFNTQILPKVVDAKAAIEDVAPILDKIGKRDAYLKNVANLQGTIEDITGMRAEIAGIQGQMGTGLDDGMLQAQINTLQRKIEATFTTFVGDKVGALKGRIAGLEAQKAEPGADVPALQTQIDAIQADVDHWQADYDSRVSIFTKKNEVAALEIQRLEPGADTAAIDQQIAALQAEIGGLEAGLEAVDLPQVAQMRDDQQAAADAIPGLPLPGADTQALSAKLTEQKNRAANYLIAAAGYEKLASAYDFGADGSVPAGGAQTDANRKIATGNYVSKQERLTRAGALLNDQYFRETVNSFTSASQMLEDSRIVSYLKAAFGLSTYGAIVTSTLENALTTPASEADLEDPDNFIRKNYSGRPYYNNLIALSRAFNFNSDGTLPAGKYPVDADKLLSLSNGYFSGYNDVVEAADERAITGLKKALGAFNTTAGKIANVDHLVNNAAVYEFAMKAVGLDVNEVSKRIMKNVLKSDLQDPKSFVYTLKDDRYLQFAKLFNFDKDGKLTWARMAQSEERMKNTAKDYIIQKTRFLSGTEKKTAKAAAEKEAEHYTDKLGKISTRKELLADRRLIDVALVARGIDPKKVTNDYIRKIFESDLGDPKSFANTEKDYRFAEIAASYNFDRKGNVIRTSSEVIQTAGGILETTNLYLRQTIESTQGEENAGVRLALYFERKVADITSAYDILSDNALSEVFRTVFSLPDEVAAMDVDQQAKLVDKYMKLSELKNPDKLAAMLRRFTVMYDLKNNSTGSLAATLLSGAGATITGDTLMAIAQLRGRR